jgi:2-oxoisovalerate dehydrogenase E1 component
VDPYLVYRDLIRDVDSPTIVIENKMLYGQYVSGTAPEGFSWENNGARYPTTRLSSGDKPDLTIVCYGGVLYDVEKVVDKLIDEHELVPEIVVPMSLYPLDIAPILDSVARSGRLLTVEEGQGFCGFGSEVLAKLQEAAPGILKSCGRHSAMPAAIPSAKPAEDLMLPGTASILAAALEVINRG